MATSALSPPVPVPASVSASVSVSVSNAAAGSDASHDGAPLIGELSPGTGRGRVLLARVFVSAALQGEGASAPFEWVVRASEGSPAVMARLQAAKDREVEG